MDTFLMHFAQRNNKVGLSKTWVLLNDHITEHKKFKIAAYYTLASCSIIREDLPVTQSLPAYPIPITLLARIAIDTTHQGKGLGSKVLITALRQAVILSDLGLPSYGVVLDVLDQQALEFYQNFDVFKPFSDNPMRLFIPMATLRKI